MYFSDKDIVACVYANCIFYSGFRRKSPKWGSWSQASLHQPSKTGVQKSKVLCSSRLFVDLLVRRNAVFREGSFGKNHALLSYRLAEISNIVYRFYNNPNMKSNLNANQKCAAHPLAHRKERKTGEKPLKCLTTLLLLL